MLRSVAGKVMWVGRATVFVVGLVVTLALVLGAATTAMGATGGSFILGKANAATTVSKLTASIAGPALTLVNQSTEAAATALNISVASGKAPVKVNAAAGTATNLSADELDGQDSTAFLGANDTAADAQMLDGRDSSQFLPTSTYTKTLAVTTNGSGGINGSGWSCDAGDVLLSGGGKLNDADKQEIVQSKPLSTLEWFVSVKDDTTGQGVGFEITVLCADLGAPHTG